MKSQNPRRPVVSSDPVFIWYCTISTQDELFKNWGVYTSSCLVLKSSFFYKRLRGWTAEAFYIKKRDLSTRGSKRCTPEVLVKRIWILMYTCEGLSCTPLACVQRTLCLLKQTSLPCRRDGMAAATVLYLPAPMHGVRFLLWITGKVELSDAEEWIDSSANRKRNLIQCISYDKHWT